MEKKGNVVRIFLPLFCLLFSLVCAQNETNNWYFGTNAGITFENGEVAVLSDDAMNTPAGCASISDNAGSLVLYTNGQKIWNRNHQIMSNGDGLYGDIEGIQSAIVIPKPNDTSTYYVFYTRESTINDPEPILSGVYFSEIHFSPQNPLGIVVIKNQRLASSATSRLSSIYHFESNTYRLISVTKPDVPILAPNGEALFVFRIFSITDNGLDSTPVLVTINENIRNLGPVKISPNGKHIALVDEINMKIHTYKYDTSDNTITFYKTIPSVPAFGLFLTPFGLEFSQDSKMLYYTGADGQGISYIVQIQFSRFDDLDIPDYYYFIERNAKSLQLARNGKIYVTKAGTNFSTNRMSIIHKPEKPGSECAFESSALNMSPGSLTKGLPIFIVSSLRNRIVVSDDACVNSDFQFGLDLYAPILSVYWDFGDGGTSTALNPLHAFLTPGSKKVKAIVTTPHRIFTLYKTIEVFPPPLLLPNQTLTQCDTDNDGVSVFNLENISDFISNSNSEFQYSFYHDLQAALNNESPISNPNQYSNRTNPEQLFVKVITDKGCPLVTSFFIENTYTTTTTPLPTFYVCENSDAILNNSKGKFDLESIQSEISNLLDIPSNYEVNFYSSFLDAQTKLNKLSRYYTAFSSTLWIRIEDENNGCNGIFSFQIVVNSEIETAIDEVYTICDSNVGPPYVLDGGGSNSAWTWRDINNQVLSTDRFFNLEQGWFSVILEKHENGLVCSETKYFAVVNALAPIIDRITAENNEIKVSILNPGNYEFSLDNITYYGSGNSHTFNAIEPGNYSIYVHDINGCKFKIQENVLLLKYPNYFTPNGDGVNDFWNVFGPLADYFSSAELVLFNRFGNILYSSDLLSEAPGWDGTFNARNLPASDYWFKVTFKDLNNQIIVKTGHFSLIR